VGLAWLVVGVLFASPWGVALPDAARYREGPHGRKRIDRRAVVCPYGRSDQPEARRREAEAEGR
jgi:hypothetical protein